MPELPEVETVRKTLEKLIVNKKIVRFFLLKEKVLKTNHSANEIKTLLKNEIIENIKRHGKYLIIESTHYILVSHLRMEGKFFYLKSEQANANDLNIDENHVLYKIEFEDKSQLLYHDTRRFGTLHIIDKSVFFNNYSKFIKAGLEPFDVSIDAEFIWKKWVKKKKMIKSLLLEQDLIAGIGNIYACEILFASKISPTRFSNTLTLENVKDILSYTKQILQKAVENGGSSVNSYTSFGLHGKFQNYLNVYGKANQKCNVCSNKISKIKINGRGTYFCNVCQT